MANQMSYYWLISLKEMALRKIAVILWDGNDILTSSVEWKSKILKLDCPVTLKEELWLGIRDHIGSEIENWKKFHEAYMRNAAIETRVLVLRKLCWTSSGVVDYKKTAEEITRSGLLDTVQSFNLACLYCLEDCIFNLWDELPTHVQNIYPETHDFWFMKEVMLQFAWPCILSGKLSHLDRILEHVSGFHRYALEHSAAAGNKAATEYFLQKVNYNREALLFQTVSFVFLRKSSSGFVYVFPKEKFSEVVLYLLSLMRLRTQKKIFKKYPCEVFSCCLERPYQYLLEDITALLVTLLTESQYITVLSHIIENTRRIGCYFPNVFEKVFTNCPDDCKRKFVDYERESCPLFPELLRTGDTKTIRVIFRNILHEDKWRLVSCYKFFRLFSPLIMNNRWSLVKFCLIEAVPSRDDMESVKRIFVRFSGYKKGYMRLKRRKWISFFDSLFQQLTTEQNK